MLMLILTKTWQHIFLVLFALLVATSFALPLAFFLRQKRFASPVLRTAELIQTIPGLAMISLIVVLLAQVPFLPTTGLFPALVALVLYALAPLLTSTYTGISQINPALIEVAIGVGMTKRQRLWMVEVPASIPFIIAGMRIAGVSTIGMGTLMSLIGGGGLGDLIVQGLRSMQPKLILAGTLPAILLALFFEIGIGKVEKWLHEPTTQKI